MKFKAYTGITWSLLELTSLIEDEDSHVHLERVKKHLGLHPFHLTNLHAALNEILSANLNFYDAELKGFPLAYKNPKVITPLGEVFYDTCFIHVDIEADFYVFRPHLEAAVTGIVNKKGLNHIGVLVHKAFNVSIPSPEGTDEWVGSEAEIGQQVKFHIAHLDFNSRLPYIRGILDEEEYLARYKPVQKKESKPVTDESSISKRQSKSKNRSRKLSCMSLDENSDDTLRSDLENSQEVSKKQTKKTSKKSAKKEVQVPDKDTPTENGKSKKRGKKLIIKSKELCSSSESEDDCRLNDIKQPESILHNSISEYSDREENDSNFTPKQNRKKFNDSVLSENAEKSSSKKRSKKSKLSDVKSEFDIDKVKPDPEYTVASSNHLKSKKRPKNENSDTDDSMNNNEYNECSKTSRKQLKKLKSDSHVEDNEVQVKIEDTEDDDEALKITATPKKRRSKLKRSLPSSDVDEIEEKPTIEVIKKQAKRAKEANMIFDYDDVVVKDENLNDSTKNIKNCISPKKNKSEQSDESSNEPEKKSKNKSKKLSRSYHNMSDTEGDYASVGVKSENVDSAIACTKREHVFESPTNVTVKKKAEKRKVTRTKGSPISSAESECDSPFKYVNKRKHIGFDLDEDDLGIKRERSFSVKREDIGSTKNREEEVETTRTSPKKQSRKRQSSTADTNDAYFMPIKIEDVYNESLHLDSEEEAQFDKHSPKKQSIKSFQNRTSLQNFTE